MRKSRIALCFLLMAWAFTFTSCETFFRAFADQAGRNAADALMGKAAASWETPR